MKVITLTDDEFSIACKKLYYECNNNAPQVIVSIATGGDYVADEMRRYSDASFVSIAKKRPSTKRKNSFLGGMFLNIISTLPYWLLNGIRNFEHQILTRKNTENICIDTIALTFDSKIFKDSRVLIVDDAIDTGLTMASVKHSLLTKYPEINNIIIAALVQTTKNPVIPSYQRYIASHILAVIKIKLL